MVAAAVAPLERGVLDFEVVPLQGSTPFALWGSYPVVLYALLLLLRHTRLLQSWRRRR